MLPRARAIVWAQWRTVRNNFPRSNTIAVIFSALLAAIWYGTFSVIALSAAFLMSDPRELAVIAKILPVALLVAFVYWQMIPLLLVTTGSALEIKKLVVYPIPTGELFALEVLLRISTGIEVIIVLIGAGVGLLFNPRMPIWTPLSLVVFTLFNLFLSAGIRDLLVRLFARRVVREVLIFVFVIAAGLPQVLVLTGAAANAKKMVAPFAHLLWPWTATAVLAQGHFTAADAGALGAWTVAAFFFGRSQFERGLRFDVDEVSARKGSGVLKNPLEGFFRFPSRLFADPLAVLIEKELRVLARSARFRLVFIMGFSFGLLIWLPLAFGPAGSQGGFLGRNYLTLVSGYALVLLGDVLFWNVFGFDRSAAQIYFVAPVRIQTVLQAKNLAAFIYICIEVGLISMVCALLRFPVSPGKVVEAYAVTFTIALLLMGAGNLSSVYNPRAIDPSKSFRNSAGRQTQAALMLVFPFAFAPAALAYAARYAFDSNVAFYLTLLFSIVFAAVLYRVSMQSAVGASERRKEAIIFALSVGQSPIAS